MNETELITRLQTTIEVLERARIKPDKSCEDMKFNLGFGFCRLNGANGYCNYEKQNVNLEAWKQKKKQKN